MEPSAQIKLYAQTVTQFVFYESNSAKCSFIFNWPNNLDNSNFGQLYVFEVDNTKCGDFAPKPRKGIELVLFTQCCFKIMQHGHLEMIKLQIKHVSWKEWKNILL